MARVQWQNVKFHAKPLRELPNGDWIMEAAEHGARFSIGTQIRVEKREIIDLDAPIPGDRAGQSLADLENALAAERKTIPSIKELLDRHRADLAKNGEANGPQEESRA